MRTPSLSPSLFYTSCRSGLQLDNASLQSTSTLQMNIENTSKRATPWMGNTMDVLRPCFVCVAIIALLIAGAARRPPGRSQGEAGRRAAPPVRPGTWGGPGTCARLWAGDAAAAGTAAAFPGGRSRLRPLLPAASICGAVSGLSCLHACCRAGLDATERTGDINAVPFGLRTTTFITADRGGCQKCMVIELQTCSAAIHHVHLEVVVPAGGNACSDSVLRCAGALSPTGTSQWQLRRRRRRRRWR